MEWYTAQLLEDFKIWFEQWQWSEALGWLQRYTGGRTEFRRASTDLQQKRRAAGARLPEFRVLDESRAASVFTKITWQGNCQQSPPTKAFDRERLLRLFAASGQGELDARRLLNILLRECPDLQVEVEGRTGTVMLADFLKLRLAQTSCRLETGDIEKPYLFVGADLSGIQNFIYTVRPKGALKTLRGRSFFLQLVMVDFADRVLRELDLQDFHQVYVGGGGGYLLLPNTNRSRRAVEEAAATFNQWALQTLQGKLFLAAGWIEMDDGDFEDSTVWGKAAREVGRAKSRRYVDQLGSGADSSPLTPREVSLRACEVCRTDENPLEPAEGEGGEVQWMCSFCRRMERLGRDLPSAWGIRLEAGADPRTQGVEIAGRWYRLLVPGHPTGESGRAPDSTWMFLREDSDLSQAERWLMPPGYARTEDEDGETRTERQAREPWTFEKLAQTSTGDKRLGVLRMDVDNLGLIFARGMSNEDRHFANMSALSRQLSGFFSETLNALCLKDRNEGRGKFHIIYAGGDDLFMVGSWDDLASFSRVIAGEFTRVTGRNPGMTISGGLIIADYHVPLYQLAEWAGEAEEWSKDRGKNRMTLFYSPRIARSDTQFPMDVPWDVLEDAVTALLQPLQQLGSLPRRFIQYSRGYPDLVDRGAAHFAQYLFRMARVRVTDEEKEAWEAVKQKLVQREFYPAWRVIFTWLALWTREVEDDVER